MRLRDRPRHYRRTPLQQKLWGGYPCCSRTSAMPSSPQRKASRTRWVNGLPTIPTAAYLAAESISPTTGPAGREGKKNAHLSMCAAHGVCNEVWCCPCPTNQRTPIHHCLTPAQRHAQCNNVTLGRRLPIQPSAEGNKSLMWGFPHYKDARMQHSQSRKPALPGVTTAVAPRGVPASTNEVFPASPT